jgi:hypothetical protein
MQTLKVLSLLLSYPEAEMLSRSHALRGNAVKGALRRESRPVYKNAHRANTGRGASGTAFPRSAWERAYQGIPSVSVGTIKQEQK